jgi:transaldolase/glucose-6-phosphate isomerase
VEIRAIQRLGQSVWLDYLRRDLLASGGLARLVRDDGISGITTNPDIFNKALSAGTDYDTALERDVGDHDEPASVIYEHLVIDDIQHAADVLRPVFDTTHGRDGFVSLEVSPYVAYDTIATVAEARRLWKCLARPNVMIKVPGTRTGFPAVEQLTREGLNVNITLLFGRKACLRVHDAYMAGLEARVVRGEAIDRIASVASMFVSRIDVLVEQILHERHDGVTGLLGEVGIANAKLAYEDWRQVIASPRWQKLARHGARPQRLLWASTGTKSPALSDVHYVEALIGPDTIDTIPPKTLDAFRHHGVAANRLSEGLDTAREVMERLARAGVSIDHLALELVEQGVRKFAVAFDELLATISKKRDHVLALAR